MNSFYFWNLSKTMVKFLLLFLIFFVGGGPSLILGDPLCPNNEAVETQSTLCNNGKLPRSHFRLKTLRDLAWFLTPRTYFLTNANSYTYRLLYQTLLGGSCAKDVPELEKMKVHASMSFGHLKISALDRLGGRKYMTLSCSPKSRSLKGLWGLVTRELRSYNNINDARSPLDFPKVENVIMTVGKMNPHLEDVVPDLGHIQCHSLCNSPNNDANLDRDDPPCSDGIQNSFTNFESVLAWTDHISNTTETTGSAFMLMNCINNDKIPSWSVFSTVIQQGRDSIDEFWGIARKYSFNEDKFSRQNYY